MRIDQMEVGHDQTGFSRYRYAGRLHGPRESCMCPARKGWSPISKGLTRYALERGIPLFQPWIPCSDDPEFAIFRRTAYAEPRDSGNSANDSGGNWARPLRGQSAGARFAVDYPGFMKPGFSAFANRFSDRMSGGSRGMNSLYTGSPPIIASKRPRWGS